MGCSQKEEFMLPWGCASLPSPLRWFPVQHRDCTVLPPLCTLAPHCWLCVAYDCSKNPTPQQEIHSIEPQTTTFTANVAFSGCATPPGPHLCLLYHILYFQRCISYGSILKCLRSRQPLQRRKKHPFKQESRTGTGVENRHMSQWCR